MRATVHDEGYCTLMQQLNPNETRPRSHTFASLKLFFVFFLHIESRHRASDETRTRDFGSLLVLQPACNSDQARAASGALIGLTCLTEASMADPGADAYAPFRRVRLPGKGSGLLAPALTNACRMPKPYKAVFGLSRARFGGDVANDSLAISPNRCGEEGKLQANKRCKGLYSALVPCV